MFKKIDRLIYLILKRILDIILGILGCILLIPITIIIWICKKVKRDNNKIFYTQKRIGQNGKTITIIKFKSMVDNAEQILEKLMEEDEAIRKEYSINKKLENDPRITEIGKILRETSIDEFPQFINILIGNMSFVGPRPYLLNEKVDMGNYYNDIIKVKPGITGLWQIAGRSKIPFNERLKLEQEYSKKAKLILDIKIILKTILKVIKKEGAI
ncbi:MAG: sugar transferase [Clostridium sp.]